MHLKNLGNSEETFESMYLRNEYFNFVKLSEFESWKKHMCCWGKWP